MEQFLSVTAICKQDIEKIWECWTESEHIKEWYFASPDWFVPYASGPLIENGDFIIRMAPKDESTSFDFKGTYTRIKEHEFIEYFTEDGRQVLTLFQSNEDETITIFQKYEPEESNPLDVQQRGWQSILDNFVKYAEKLKSII